MTMMERFRAERRGEGRPCPSAGSTTRWLRPGHDTHGYERHADVPGGRVDGADRSLGARRRARQGEKTLLSRPSSGRLTDGETTATIEHRDPLPQGPLARRGRTAAVHVIEHVEKWWQAPRVPGFGGRVAGRELRLTPLQKFAGATVRRGRPPSANPKVSTTIRLSRDVIEHFRAGGRGWQTRIDAALREWIAKHDVA